MGLNKKRNFLQKYFGLKKKKLIIMLKNQNIKIYKKPKKIILNSIKNNINQKPNSSENKSENSQRLFTIWKQTFQEENKNDLDNLFKTGLEIIKYKKDNSSLEQNNIKKHVDLLLTLGKNEKEKKTVIERISLNFQLPTCSFNNSFVKIEYNR